MLCERDQPHVPPNLDLSPLLSASTWCLHFLALRTCILIRITRHSFLKSCQLNPRPVKGHPPFNWLDLSGIPRLVWPRGDSFFILPLPSNITVHSSFCEEEYKPPPCLGELMEMATPRQASTIQCPQQRRREADF